VTIASLDEVLDGDRIGRVIIATPADTHEELARKCLEADKHVLVEKPSAMDLDGHVGLSQLAAKRNKVLFVGHVFLYNPGVCRLAELIQTGFLGDGPLYAHSTQLSPGRIRQQEDVLLSFAPHDVSILLKLIGGAGVESIQAFGAHEATPGHPGTCFMHLRFAGGHQGHIHVSWIHPQKERKVLVVGSKRAALFDDVAQSLKVFDRTMTIDAFEREPQDIWYDKSRSPLELEYKVFESACTLSSRGVAHNPTLDTKVMTTLEMARKALEMAQ
jgi:predicted dehydrogenase